MPSTTPTGLLKSWRDGDRDALNLLLPLIYDELARMAHGAMAAERRDHTLQTRALVHEAYLRLIEADVAVNDRAHFLALAARTMRRILTDHARSRQRVKRGSEPVKVGLTALALIADDSRGERGAGIDPVDLDVALTALAAQDERKAQLLELLYYGGLTYEEAALALGISRASLGRELQIAKAWLARALGLKQP